jgi:hypothetical protein
MANALIQCVTRTQAGWMRLARPAAALSLDADAAVMLSVLMGILVDPRARNPRCAL